MSVGARRDGTVYGAPTRKGIPMSMSQPSGPTVTRDGRADLVSAIVLGVCLTGLLVGVLLGVSPAVTPERFTILSLFGIIIMVTAIPVSVLSLVATAYFVVRAVLVRARRGRLLAVLWVATAALTAVSVALLYMP